MSWDPYIKSIQGDASVVRSVAICGKEGFAVWAASPGFVVKPEEIKALFGDSKAFAQCGPNIGGIKCRMLRDNKDTEGMHCIDFKSSADSEGNAYNVYVGYTHTAIIIAFGTKEASGGQISTAVYSTLKYLRDSKI